MKNEDFKRYKKYARKMLRGDILQDEEASLQAWLESDDALPVSVPSHIAPSKEAHESKLYKKIRKGGPQSGRSRAIRRISIAAAFAVFIGIAILYNYINRKNNDGNVKSALQSNSFLAPGGNKAVLTLSNGKQLTLSDCRNGNIADDEGVKINKNTDGSLSYKPEMSNIKSVTNVLQIPAGGQYNMVLPDGTKVWLNSKSTLQYPTVFSGKERRVIMTGEAYFEVAHDSLKPFHVAIGGLDIKVLGTHFNVNGYKDDGFVRTTLIEGLITATTGSQTLSIKPTEQCRLDNSGALTLQKNINIDEVLAWKNNEFDFGENSDIHTVMKQLARWYDFDIEYQNPLLNARVAGGISKTVNGYETLKMIERTGTVKFKINGKKVIVMSP